MRILLFTLALLALCGAASVPICLGFFRRQTGFRFTANGDARVIASDVGMALPLLLRDERLGLCGKPDYLLERTVDGVRQLVPLEVKPSRHGERLYDSDRIQLGAYLIALRATAAERASRIGYVRYSTRTFEVPLTPELETEVVRLIAAIRRGRLVSTVHRSHNVAARCRACPVRRHCDEALSS